MDFEPIDNDDDTGITVAPYQAAAPRTARKDVVRIGRFSIPSLAAAAVLSVAAHAGVIALAVAGVWLYSCGPTAVKPWGAGANGGDVTMGADAAGTPLSSGLPPGAEERPAEKLSSRSNGASEFADEKPQWSSEHVSLTTALDEEQADSQIIGIRGLAAGGGPRQHPQPGNKSVAPVTVDSNAPTPIEAAGGMTATGPSSGPGLPGAIGLAGLPAPSYPPEALSRGEQGVVKVAIEVFPDGKVGDIRIFKRSNYPLLDRAAITAAQKLRAYQFVPARRLGVPVTDSLVIPYAFTLR